MEKRLCHLLGAWALLMALAGCQVGGSEPQRLVYGLTLVPSGIDPHIHASSELGIPLSSVYDTLVFLDPESRQFVPGLAAEWTISEDGLAYTFALREGVRFHDGTRFDAQAVRFNLERVVDPETGSQKARYMLGQLDRVEVVDDLTVVIHLASPYAPLLDSLSQVYLGMASPTAVERWGNVEYQFHQVGTGPYKLAEYIPGDHLTLVRNSDYEWGPAHLRWGDGSVDEIEFRFYEDPSTRAMALESGQVQVMGEIPPQDADRFEAAAEFKLHPAAIPGQPLQLLFNTARAPTDELAVRQALIFATDRETIVRTVFGPWSPVASGPLSRVTLGHVSDSDQWYRFDRNRAQVLLDEAGWVDSDGDGIRDRDGQALAVEVYHMGWGMVPEVIQMIENDWANVGVRTDALLVSYPAALAAATRGDHNAIPFNLVGTDPAQLSSFFTSGGGFNFAHVQDEQLDAWLSQAEATGDTEERLVLYGRAQEYIMEHALVLPIRDYVNLNASSSRVKGLRFDARGWFPLLAGLQLEY